MAQFVFKSLDGTVTRTAEFPVGKAPDILKVDGVPYVRDYAASAPAVVMRRGPSGPQPLPRNIPGIRERTKDGTPVVRNIHDARNIEAANPGLKFNPEHYHERSPRALGQTDHDASKHRGR